MVNLWGTFFLSDIVTNCDKCVFGITKGNKCYG